MTIDGNPVRSTRSYEVINPADGTVVGLSPQGSSALVDEAVASARRAYPAWAALSDPERSKKILAIADLIEQHHPELSRLITLEQGKPRVATCP